MVENLPHKGTRKTHGKYLSLLLSVSLLLFASCHPWDHPSDDDVIRRTVLVYMVAENSLSYGDFHQQDLDELLSASDQIPANCRLLVYVDDTDLPRLYEVRPSTDTKATGATLLKSWMEDMDSCDPEILRQLMTIATTLYPAESYGLVFWSHGSAWLPASRTPRRTIGIDNGLNSYSNTGSKMEISELREALESFPKLDFLMFDACFMQTIEVAWELRDVTRYIIASPAEIPNPGAPYHRIIASMFSSEADVEGIIDQYYHHYADSAIYIGTGYSFVHGAVLSVVDCQQLPVLCDATKKMIDRYGKAVVDTSTETFCDGILRYFPISSSDIPEYYDMKAFMRRLITSDDDLKQWTAAFEKAVPFRRTTESWFTSYARRNLYIGDVDGYGGISMYVPHTDTYYEKINIWFSVTSWYSVSGWNKLF